MYLKGGEGNNHINNLRKGSQPPTPQDKAEMAFKLYDKDKDGFITRAEMVKLSKNLTKEQVEKVKMIIGS